MRHGFDLRWLLRRHCRAIVVGDSTFDGYLVSIVLCRRWRWHRGECRGAS